MIGIFTAFLGTFLAMISDLKTSYIPNEIPYMMIGVGVLWTALNYSLYTAFFIYIIAIIVFLFGFIMYSFGQFGGGDIKLFTALALLVPYYIGYILVFSILISNFKFWIFPPDIKRVVKDVSKLDNNDTVFFGFKKYRSFHGFRLDKFKKNMKKQKIKAVLVCENLPRFTPYIFFSLILVYLLLMR